MWSSRCNLLSDVGPNGLVGILLLLDNAASQVNAWT